MNHPIQTLSQNLRSLRRLHRYTLEEVAGRIGVSRQAVAKWETGETAPDMVNCDALAQLYQVSLDDLVHHDAAERGVPVPPKGKHVFGTVTVGDRGQVVIPKRARDLFNIRPGDSLMVLGDEEMGTRGLALVDPQLFFAHLEYYRRMAEGEETP